MVDNSIESGTTSSGRGKRFAGVDRYSSRQVVAYRFDLESGPLFN